MLYVVIQFLDEYDLVNERFYTTKEQVDAMKELYEAKTAEGKHAIRKSLSLLPRVLKAR